MIGKLKGNIEEICEDYLLLDVQGVCYTVYCSARTLKAIGKAGDSCVLFIETHVRQDQIRLFGFFSTLDRDLFILLQSVQGIGVRIALAILSTLTSVELINAIVLQDKTIIVRSPGIGEKVAGRIVSELKEKVSHLIRKTDTCLTFKQNVDQDNALLSDVISALANLGYTRDQATIAVSSVFRSLDGVVDDSQLIRLALKELSR
ncbi:Holliday junction DNA helicase RuvA [Liberibacter crescens BT-1]|uniref:Holliday junction branch migration complex subunit RuvA n=1 Tax=Liberibacter crescens (strain BT-1) TaxID=1215343 RepID=L0ETP4_LIBCB|nr:Holliday junction branch migration protein RuvA [Liberibacter crescens]AGA64337.1 Holliday junction DNA helicase RuvA [Liberibacter crescens BT-1]AMC12541.1 ATP-dependent DNA helicase RuvA [Liberibacter crescens]